MARHGTRPTRAIYAAVTLAAASMGCVESFGGSNLQLDFSQSTPVPGGTDFDGVRPPDDTYLAFYAIDHVYALDADGNVMENELGEPIIEESYLFEVERFEIVPLIDLASPCFIELEENTRFPGLHVTQVATKLRESLCERYGLPASCFDNAFDPPNGATEDDVRDVLTADVRMENLTALQQVVKAVVTYSAFRYPAAAADCNVSGDQIPAPSCRDDASNAQRLRVCRQLWDRPEADGFYEGSDKVFTLPLHGTLYGTVHGTNPINQGFLGGATLNVDAVLGAADVFAINWQFKDYDGDGEPDYPDGFLDTHQASPTGYTWMIGEPDSRTRGVINGRLTSPLNPSVYVDLGIFSGIGEDDVNF